MAIWKFDDILIIKYILRINLNMNLIESYCCSSNSPIHKEQKKVRYILLLDFLEEQLQKMSISPNRWKRIQFWGWVIFLKPYAWQSFFCCVLKSRQNNLTAKFKSDRIPYHTMIYFTYSQIHECLIKTLYGHKNCSKK